MNAPIKYYGGKFFMKDFIISNFPSSYEIYVEGFGGSASILLSKTPTPIEIYNDLGDNVYSLYKVIGDEKLFHKLVEKMELLPYSEKLRREFINDLNKKQSLFDRAYKFLYVNRASFNGVGGFSVSLTIRRGIVRSVADYIGMIENLPEIHERFRSVIVEHRDILEIIEKYDREGTFFYLDPPYIQSTRSSGQKYEVEMSDDEHRKMIDLILQSKGKFLISGYNHEIYSKLEDNGFTRIDFNSGNSSSDRIESLWKNYENGNNTVGIDSFF